MNKLSNKNIKYYLSEKISCKEYWLSFTEKVNCLITKFKNLEYLA